MVSNGEGRTSTFRNLCFCFLYKIFNCFNFHTTSPLDRATLTLTPPLTECTSSYLDFSQRSFTVSVLQTYVLHPQLLDTPRTTLRVNRPYVRPLRTAPSKVDDLLPGPASILRLLPLRDREVKRARTGLGVVPGMASSEEPDGEPLMSKLQPSRRTAVGL